MRYWGTETTQGQESICLLVQSENAKQWGIFQQSLGIYLMYEVITGRPMNRCLRLSLPIRVELPNRLKVLSFRFDSKVFTAVREKVLKNWRKWENSWRHEGIEVFGNWLEDDAAPYAAEYADLTFAAVKGQNKVFLVLAWNWDEEEVKIAENDARILEAGFKEEMMTEGTKDLTVNEFLISKSVQTKFKTEKNDSFSDTKPQSTVDCLASLLRLSPPRRHSETPVGNSPYFSFSNDSRSSAGKP